MGKMPANPIQLLGAGLVVTVGLAATSGAVSAPATGSRLAADAAQGKSKIAFISRGLQRRPGLYVVSADGSGQRRLTGTCVGPYSCVVARRAEDRLRRPCGPARAGVYVVNADGSFRAEAGAPRAHSRLVARRADDRVLQRLQDLPHERRRERAPAPDDACGPGRTLSCVVARRAEARLPLACGGCGQYCFNLYVVNSDGSGLRNLTSKLAAGGQVSVLVSPPTLSGRPTDGRSHSCDSASGSGSMS